jgi:hypothetical protein
MHLNKKQIGGWMPFPYFLKSNFGCMRTDEQKSGKQVLLLTETEGSYRTIILN